MRLLTINIGNSNIAFGLFRDGVLEKSTRFSWAGTDVELELKRQEIFRTEISDIMICSVVPALNPVFQNTLAEWKPSFITHASSFSFKNKTAPNQTGLDRLVAAEAAYREYGSFEKSLIIVDAGTATTINVVSHRNEFLGGAITTGLQTSFEALTHRAAQLHGVALGIPRTAIGAATREALDSGAVLGHASMIDGMIRRMTTELDATQVQVVLTGGLGATIAPYLQTKFIYDPDLVLKGIAYLKP